MVAAFLFGQAPGDGRYLEQLAFLLDLYLLARSRPVRVTGSPASRAGCFRTGDRREAQQHDRDRLGAAWADTGLIFTTRTGRPVEPRNLVRSFAHICDDSGIRIRVHALRHTTASLLKKLAIRRRTLR